MRAIGVWCIIQLLISWSIGGNFEQYFYAQSTGWLAPLYGWFLGAVFGDAGTLLIGALNSSSGAVVVIAAGMKLGLIGAAFTRTSRELLDLAPWLIVGQFLLAMYVVWIEPYTGWGSALNDGLTGEVMQGSGHRLPGGRTLNFGGKIPVTVILGIGCLIYFGAAKAARDRFFGTPPGK